MENCNSDYFLVNFSKEKRISLTMNLQCSANLRHFTLNMTKKKTKNERKGKKPAKIKKGVFLS